MRAIYGFIRLGRGFGIMMWLLMTLSFLCPRPAECLMLGLSFAAYLVLPVAYLWATFAG